MSAYCHDWKHLRVPSRPVAILLLISDLFVFLGIVPVDPIQILTTVLKVTRDMNPRVCGLFERDMILTNKREEGWNN